MFLKIENHIINTDFIQAINKSVFYGTEEEPYAIFFQNGKFLNVTEKAYNKILPLLKPMEID